MPKLSVVTVATILLSASTISPTAGADRTPTVRMKKPMHHHPHRFERGEDADGVLSRRLEANTPTSAPNPKPPAPHPPASAPHPAPKNDTSQAKKNSGGGGGGGGGESTRQYSGGGSHNASGSSGSGGSSSGGSGSSGGSAVAEGAGSSSAESSASAVEDSSSSSPENSGGSSMSGGGSDESSSESSGGGGFFSWGKNNNNPSHGTNADDSGEGPGAKSAFTLVTSALGVGFLVAGLTFFRQKDYDDKEHETHANHRLQGSIKQRMTTFSHLVEMSSRSSSGMSVERKKKLVRQLSKAKSNKSSRQLEVESDMGSIGVDAYSRMSEEEESIGRARNGMMVV